MKLQVRSLCLVAALLASGAARAEPPDVVVSIAPIHSLAAAVMEGIAEPELLVPGSVSEHDYALKPSDVRQIAGADLVVWVGEALESYLGKVLGTEGARHLALLDAPGMEPRPFADPTDAAEPDSKTHGGDQAEGHDHGYPRLDPHIWLDPVRAQRIVHAIAEALVAMDPANAEAYRQNATRTVAALADLHGRMAARLAPLAGRPFITFHDGYSYFVERYGLEQVGQLTADPEIRPGAATIRDLREIVAAGKVGCVFAEPQFHSAVVESLADKGSMKIGTLDAIGADLEPGPALYFSLMERNMQAVESCLLPSS